MKVLISGGGIAGNALAFWLTRLGYTVTVVERFPALRATGLQVDLRGHGIEVLRRMGLEPAFRARAAPEQGLQVVGDSGKRWAYFSANKSGNGTQNFTSDFEIMRGDFCQLMYDAVKLRVRYIFGTSVESFEETKDAVEVHFSDGKTESFDLVVGADGQWSRVRELMLGPCAGSALRLYKGVYTAYFTVPLPAEEEERYMATVHMSTRQRGLMTRRHSRDAIQVYLACKTDSAQLASARRGDVADEKDALAEIFQGAGWRTEGLLKGMRESTDFYCERMGLVKTESWSRGQVVLVGDAAYCPSAGTGMGTTSAIVGSYILAGEIGRHCEVPGLAADGGTRLTDKLTTALKEYERKFRPFMDQVQKGMEEGQNYWAMVPTSSCGITVANLLLGVASFLGFDVLGKYLLREEVIGWDLPEYEEISQNRAVP